MANKNYKTLELDTKYVPKKSEEYMSSPQKAYFYKLLIAMREDATAESGDVLNAVRLAERTEFAGVGDETDSSTLTQELEIDLRNAQRNDTMLRAIDAALERLENNSYGLSVVSGDEIGLARMLSQPLATMTTEEQEEYEKR